MKESYLNALYRRLAGRRGKKRALVAVGRTILQMTYYMIKRGSKYKDLGADYYERRDPKAWPNTWPNASRSWASLSPTYPCPKPLNPSWESYASQSPALARPKRGHKVFSREARSLRYDAERLAMLWQSF